MRSYLLERELFIERSPEEIFRFFADACNLELITPPWLNFHICTPSPITMKAGALIDYEIRWRFVPLRWKTEIIEWNPPHQFTDVQLRGPYSLWHHTHSFAAENNGTRMIDRVRYALPGGPLGRLLHKLKVQHDLARIFDFRAERIREHFAS